MILYTYSNNNSDMYILQFLKEQFNKMGIAAIGVLFQAMLNLSRNTVRIFVLNATDLLNSNKNIVITQLFDAIDVKRLVILNFSY